MSLVIAVLDTTGDLYIAGDRCFFDGLKCVFNVNKIFSLGKQVFSGLGGSWDIASNCQIDMQQDFDFDSSSAQEIINHFIEYRECRREEGKSFFAAIGQDNTGERFVYCHDNQGYQDQAIYSADGDKYVIFGPNTNCHDIFEKHLNLPTIQASIAATMEECSSIYPSISPDYNLVTYIVGGAPVIQYFPG